MTPGDLCLFSVDTLMEETTEMLRLFEKDILINYQTQEASSFGNSIAERLKALEEKWVPGVFGGRLIKARPYKTIQIKYGRDIETQV